ncbi:unnamed protein product [Ectocarpus sp. CCAP 1310/34]|nr:unnamed protein product [Ectocarpus sp. CCAP 1310/34]
MMAAAAVWDLPEPLEAFTSTSDEPHGCSCCEDTPSSQNMVCLPPHVFAFCIVMSALVSAIVVANQRIYGAIREYLRQLLEPSASRVHNPRLLHRSASHQLDKDSEGAHVIEAAEAMDRAAAAPLALEHKIPARYVRAFCGNEKHALERWKATLKWRKENEIDAILNEPQQFFHDIRRYFPSHMSGRSRGGHIVVYEKLGAVDMRTLRRKLGVTVPMLLRHWIFVSEYMYRVLQPTDSAQQINIEDMKDVRIQTLAGKIQEYVKAVAQLARLHYVERCHKTFVVNAPAWFGLSFRVVSPFLSARTRQKIRILGSDLTVLQDEIDPQLLPVEYGGTMTEPVSDSPEERNLRRLVDAINANADAEATVAATPKNGDDGGGAKGGGRPTRRPSFRSPEKKSPKKNGKPSSVQRSPFGKTQPVPAAQELHVSPKSGRSRARTNDNATAGGGPRAHSLLPERDLGPRRATWSGSSGRGSAASRVPLPANEGLTVAIREDAYRPHTRRVVADQGGSRRRRELGSGRVGVGAERGVETERQEREGGRGSPPAARLLLGEDHHQSEEDAQPIEDRLQAVMRDLGVPLGEQERVVQGGEAREGAGGNGQRADTGALESAAVVATAEGNNLRSQGQHGGGMPALENNGDNSAAGRRTPSAARTGS